MKTDLSTARHIQSRFQSPEEELLAEMVDRYCKLDAEAKRLNAQSRKLETRQHWLFAFLVLQALFTLVQIAFACHLIK